MVKIKAQGILLDIEGTTSSIRFVYDVMFPYVRENVGKFLNESWDSDSVQEVLPLLVADMQTESVEDWLGGLNQQEQQQKVQSCVIQLMDDDVKATGLKTLQGLVWKSGFHNGQMIAHVYPDVPPALDEWNKMGMDVRIYSSGSIAAQKLFFGHTEAGDLLHHFGEHYDTTSGSKKESESYKKIASEFDCPVNEIVFVSDAVEELVAAKSAGMKTVLSIRDGNNPAGDDHGFDSIQSFGEISIELATT